MDLIETLNSINWTKKNLIRGSDAPAAAERLYPRFPVQRCLAMSLDAILYVNDLNIRASHLTNRQHYEYLLHSLSKNKRFNKLDKVSLEDKIENIQEMLGYSLQKAMQVADLIPEEEIQKAKQSEGGIIKKKKN